MSSTEPWTGRPVNCVSGEEHEVTVVGTNPSAAVDGEEDSRTTSSDGTDDSSSSTVLTEEEQRRQFFDNLLTALGPLTSEKDPTQGTFAAPFGKGVATLVDTNVRRCWQVDASKLSFPGTPTFLSHVIQRLTQQAVCALGFDGRGVKVEAQLYKLLLYEKGGHFTSHRDKEKIRGMFATLILQIPTEEGYTGGNLVVEHEKSARAFPCDRKEFDCHMVGDLGFCYTVFFADCKHELRKIESGTRLCLAFNLVKTDFSLDPVYRELIDCKVQLVQAALTPWLEEATRRRSSILGAKLAILLQHKYTQENLCFAWLKGDDRILAEVLQNCRNNNNEEWLDLHLCLVTKHLLGQPPRTYRKYFRRYYYESDSDEPSIMPTDAEETIQFEKWIGPQDSSPSILFKDLRVDLEKEIVVHQNNGPFDSEPDDIKAQGYLGPSLEFWYHSAMLVVWPRLLSTTVACEANISLALDHLEKSVEASSPNFRGQLGQVLCFCDRNVLRVWGENRNASQDSITPRLLKLCSRATAVEFLQVLKLLSKSVPCKPAMSCNGAVKDPTYEIGVRNVEVATAIASSVNEFGWEFVSSHIIDLTRKRCLTQSESLAQLAKQLISMGNTRSGVIVANTIFEVLGARVCELELHNKPHFSWCQPHAWLPDHPDVEDFLKGPRETFEKRGCFQDKAHAKSFCSSYFGGWGPGTVARYSAIATPEGAGRYAFCRIQKTPRFFEDALKKWDRDQLEIKRLRLELGKLGSVVPEMHSPSMSAFWSGQGDSKRPRIHDDSDGGTVDVMNLTLLNSILPTWMTRI